MNRLMVATAARCPWGSARVTALARSTGTRYIKPGYKGVTEVAELVPGETYASRLFRLLACSKS